MARTQLTINAITASGLTDPSPTAGDAVNGNYIAGNDGRIMLRVTNTDGGAPHDITFITPGSVGGLAVADRVVSVAASTTLFIGPLAPGVYNNSSDQVDIDVADAQLDITVFRL